MTIGITVTDFGELHFQEREIKTIEVCFPLKDKPAVTWINMDGRLVHPWLSTTIFSVRGD